MCAGTTAGPVCLKKPHHIVTLQFSEVVKDHDKNQEKMKKNIVQLEFIWSFPEPKKNWNAGI